MNNSTITKKTQFSSEKIEEFKKRIWNYYKKNKRVLPWRKTTNPYYILVSEIMLQQTQVPRVIPKYLEFIKKFPTFKTLTDASFEDVLQVWSGLGYNRRAKYLKQIADLITVQYLSKMPKEPETLQTFPGIGKNTAGAIYVFSYNKPYVFIETNIRRVFIYFFFHDQEHIDDKEIFPLIEKTLDQRNPRDWYYALMDYGTYLSKTIENPNKKSKHYVKQSPLKGSVREARGRILKILLDHKNIPFDELRKKVNVEDTRFQLAFDQLQKENFIQLSNDIVTFLR